MKRKKRIFKKRGIKLQGHKTREFLSQEKMFLELWYYKTSSDRLKEKISIMLEFVDYFLKSLEYNTIVLSDERLEKIDFQVHQLVLS